MEARGGYDIPTSWMTATEQERIDNSNGCGAGWKSEKNWFKRRWKNLLNKIIPEHVWGLYIGDCCNWHDFDFTFLEKTKANFKKANERLYNNVKLRIESKTNNRLLKWARLRRAKKIKWFVDSKAGWEAFLEG